MTSIGKPHPVYKRLHATIDGDIFSTHYKQPKKLKPKVVQGGSCAYLESTYNRKYIAFSLADFVWECHNGIIPEGHVVRAKNNDYINIQLANLECKTPEEYIGSSFKEHPAHPNLLCTQSGEVFSKRTLEARWICFEETHFPYVSVGRKQIHIRLCRLIYEAFNGLLPGDLDVFYIDDDRKNNALDNLKAMTPGEYMDSKAAAVILAQDSTLRRHPTQTEYIAYPDGRVYSLLSSTFVGFKNDQNYIILRDGLSAHKVVYEAFNGLINSKKFQIDHRNQIRDDNRLSNLQKLTHREHNLKTRADNPTAVKKAGRTLSLPLMRVLYKEGHIVSSVAFENIQEALDKSAELIPGLTMRKIHHSIESTSLKRDGYVWRREDCPNMPDEEWKVIPKYPGLQASSVGRIKFSNGRKIFGCSNGVTYSINHNGKPLAVHILVCMLTQLTLATQNILWTTATANTKITGLPTSAGPQKRNKFLTAATCLRLRQFRAALARY